MAQGTAVPAPGGRLGRYELLQELGRGAMGVVYKANDPAIGRHVAIKTLRLDLWGAADEQTEAAARFAREARAIGRLSHPNIVTLYDAQREADLAYLVMECVSGQSLAALLRAGARFATQQVCGIGCQICDALAHAHAQGVVHRDIKPANLLLQANGQVKITDFGIASLSLSTLTRSGNTVGTPGYMAPEQIEGHPVDGRTDLFSLGAVLYELVSNERAFPGESISQIFYKILHADPVPLARLNRMSPPALDTAIRKALAKRPEDRYAEAAEFREALSRVTAAAEGAAAARAVPAAPAPPANGSRPSMPLLIGGAAGAAALALGLAYVLWPSPSPVPQASAPAPPAAPASTPAVPAEPGPPPGPPVPQAPRAMRVSFARDVKGVLPVGEGETFYRDDGKVVLWVRWANVRGQHTVHARWFDPEGTPADASTGPEAFDSPAEWWTTWTSLDLARLPRARPGRWRVELRLDDRVVATAAFTLVDHARPPAPAASPPPAR